MVESISVSAIRGGRVLVAESDDTTSAGSSRACNCTCITATTPSRDTHFHTFAAVVRTGGAPDPVASLETTSTRTHTSWDSQPYERNTPPPREIKPPCQPPPSFDEEVLFSLCTIEHLMAELLETTSTRTHTSWAPQPYEPPPPCLDANLLVLLRDSDHLMNELTAGMSRPPKRSRTAG